MKKEKRVFNFNLPNELRSYLKKQSEDNHTTISQYLIDLIVFDRLKKESQIGGYTIFYTKPIINSKQSEIKMELKSKIIPVHLKDKFVTQFDDKLIISEIEIEEFLKNNE
jgi:hypothetical protein